MRALPLTLTLAAALSLLPSTALAQSWALHGQAGLGTGMEGGTPGDGGVAWHLARLRATAGLDVAADEAAYQAFGVRAFVEFQRATSVGAAVHYNIAVSPNFGLFAELTGVIAPRTLLGAGAGATFVIPLGKKLGIFIEPELAALPVGSDVPKDSVIYLGAPVRGAAVQPMKSIFVRIVLVSVAIASFVTGCKKDCIRNTDCYSGEACTLGVCTLVVRGSDGATVGTMTPVAPTATATTSSPTPVTPAVDAGKDAALDAH